MTLVPNFEYVESGYRWVEGPHIHFSPNLELPDSLVQQLRPETPVFGKIGAPLAAPSTYKGLADRLAAGAVNVAKTQGHALEMAVGERKPVAYDIRLSDEPFALIGDERISLGDGKDKPLVCKA